MSETLKTLIEIYFGSAILIYIALRISYKFEKHDTPSIADILIMFCPFINTLCLVIITLMGIFWVLKKYVTSIIKHFTKDKQGTDFYCWFFGVKR